MKRLQFHVSSIGEGNLKRNSVMKPKNVLHLIETRGPGGAETMLTNLAKGLNSSKFNSLVGLLGTGWLFDQLQDNGINTVILRQRWSYDFQCLYDLVNLIREQDIALVHAHEFMMNTYGFLAARLAKVPMIATVHGKSYFSDKKRRVLAYKSIARWSGGMVAVSNDLKNFIVQKTGLNPERITTIYNGINLEKYRRNDRNPKAKRRSLGIAADAPIVGTVGNLYPVKGHTYLLKAASKVVKAFPPTKFLFIGRGKMRRELEVEAEELGIAENVMFLGFRSDIPDLLSVMDIFALPSLSEGLSLSILEAMAAGKPVVATDVGGNSEIIVDNEVGFLVPPRDPHAIASKMLLLLENKGLAREMGERAQNRVEGAFSLERMVKTYEELYERCLNEKEGHG